MHREISRDRPTARGDLQGSHVTSFVDGLKVIAPLLLKMSFFAVQIKNSLSYGSETL